ncbi:MAG: ATP synthase F1 subunit gamma [Acidobacteriota bacterium]|jgi:F-type H+-transporting ATPase subunit gamma|nr:ATP synthase F1 subunit gamma [Acidobacteriota bacterium]
MSGNLIELRRRIRSIRNTRKITRAMKTVSAAKLRKTVVELNKARPYLSRVEQLLRGLIGVVEPSLFPLLETRNEGDRVLVVLTGDKGLCGSFNSHVVRRMGDFLKESRQQKQAVRLVTLGNRGHAYCNHRGIAVEKNFSGIMARTTQDDAREVTDYLSQLFLQEKILDISFLYTEFSSASRQEVVLKPLFPVRCQWTDEMENGPQTQERDVIYEPSAADVFATLLPRFLESRILHLLIESQASEHAARMIAMDLASRNASDMIQSLTLKLNKLRQASITNELLEIITATEALQSQ